MGVCDISADYEGCVEFTKRFTSIEEPFLVYDGQEKTFYEKIADAKENCVLFHCVDHLPAEMPVEASHHFGEKLFPFVKSVVESPINKSFEEQTKDLPPEIANAVICSNGKLTPNFRYIPDLRKINEKEAQQKRYEEEAPKKGIPRNLSIVTLSLKGHLFDTKCFNSCIDICEEHSVQFRVIGWDIGNQSTQFSSVSLQMVAREKLKLSDALDKIEEVAEKCNVELENVEESTMA
uniref:LOR/SDH bifunctional enzyme conserved domain-containing protein n=1 Tax=Strombidium inclinatum TaxID=197538 RepID=A0A7S3IKI2_9SPIT|mmetsp:Transcript_24717/g.38482  ORF Transcript_24717/g.38482 Transcript_24717/m.38482 type:complete len:235 (+) Transcript_24717:1033-1737(+)